VKAAVTDPVHLASDQQTGPDWTSLLEAMGTREFDQVVKQFLLTSTGRALAAILRKHIQPADGPAKPGEPLSSLSAIEQRIAKCSDMPSREVEVCSRILFGLSSAGIALDLDISETTVKTYRKRAYHRLSIGSERELLTWYLRQWTSGQLDDESRPKAAFGN
jgi:DNA-binding NarL/FixJ family response regulator